MPIDLQQKVKILSNDLLHYNFRYRIGLNVDTVLFNPNGTCEAGGLYYTTLEFMPKFILYGDKIADVTIPGDAQVYADPEGYKWKADKIIISNIIDLKDHLCWNDEKYCLNVVKQNGLALRYVVNQTLDICLAAVKQNRKSLRYVINPTKKMLSLSANKIKSVKYINNPVKKLRLKNKNKAILESK